MSLAARVVLMSDIAFLLSNLMVASGPSGTPPPYPPALPLPPLLSPPPPPPPPRGKPSKCSRNDINVGGVIRGLLADYDQHLLPHPDGVNVTVEIHVQEISSLSEITSDFELDIMYSEIWVDPRLSFKILNICANNITLKAGFRAAIWTPDTCIINSKNSMIHSSPSENTFVILNENGEIWANYRMKVKAPCRLDLSMFPFDSQSCMLIFESYSFNGEEVRLSWDEYPITLMNKVTLPDFGLVGWQSQHMRMVYPNGIWDRLEAKFVFSRRFGFYLFQAYFPTSLTVLSSWVGFLLDTRSVSARITLGVSSLLALTFQFGTVLRHLPRVSYIKCLDVWMIACVIFIFLTLVQLAVVCQLSRRERERQVGTQVITQWLQSVRKRRAGSPQNGLIPGLTAENAAAAASAASGRKDSKWSSFISRSAPGASQGDIQLRCSVDFRGGSEEASESGTLSPEGRGRESSEATPEARRRDATERDSLIPKAPPPPVLNVRPGIAAAVRRCLEAVSDFKFSSVNVDRASMLLFPLSFALFNLVYWLYYLLQVQDVSKMNLVMAHVAEH